MTLDNLLEQWRNARDGLEAFAEIGDREGWEAERVICREIEDAIFALTGQRPPYATGWGVDLSRGE